MNKREILVAASLTNGRDVAFDRGLAIAQRSGTELYVLHAVPQRNRSRTRRAVWFRSTERICSTTHDVSWGPFSRQPQGRPTRESGS